ncbi:MAG: DUF393 domain-containing protein [Chloroflexi bacterium]|nr:DUF393 domain-containing protein [Chloroflexota bacterium]
MRERDHANRVLALPNQTPRLVERLGLTRADVDRSAWAFDADGRVYSGAAAINRVLAELPGWRWLSLIYRIRPLNHLQELVYAWIAPRRGRLGAIVGVATPTCERPGVACTPTGE